MTLVAVVSPWKMIHTCISMLLILINLEITETRQTRTFQNDCMDHVYTASEDFDYYVNFDGYAVINFTCKIGFKRGSSSFEICITPVQFSLRRCSAMLLLYNGNTFLKSYSCYDRPESYCVDSDNIQRVELHNAIWSTTDISLKIHLKPLDTEEGPYNFLWLCIGAAGFAGTVVGVCCCYQSSKRRHRGRVISTNNRSRQNTVAPVNQPERIIQSSPKYPTAPIQPPAYRSQNTYTTQGYGFQGQGHISNQQWTSQTAYTTPVSGQPYQQQGAPLVTRSPTINYDEVDQSLVPPAPVYYPPYNS